MVQPELPICRERRPRQVVVQDQRDCSVDDHHLDVDHLNRQIGKSYGSRLTTRWGWQRIKGAVFGGQRFCVDLGNVVPITREESRYLEPGSDAVTR
jgi:hypothetical protein